MLPFSLYEGIILKIFTIWQRQETEEEEKGENSGRFHKGNQAFSKHTSEVQTSANLQTAEKYIKSAATESVLYGGTVQRRRFCTVCPPRTDYYHCSVVPGRRHRFDHATLDAEHTLTHSLADVSRHFAKKKPADLGAGLNRDTNSLSHTHWHLQLANAPVDHSGRPPLPFLRAYFELFFAFAFTLCAAAVAVAAV